MKLLTMFDPYTRNKCLDVLMGKLLSIEIGVELLLNRRFKVCNKYRWR
ncbi:MAG: hypothetical protein LM582_08840 [Desulfurococcaceae archaeon]|nr:hypothetical protein [Desulfurococcaceae archaeon]